MALSQQHRTAIYGKLSPVIGDKETEALLLQFPAREEDEPVTKDHLRAELNKLDGALRGEMKDLRTELKGDIAGLRTELKGDIATVRGEMKDLRTELKGDIAGVRTELKDEIKHAMVFVMTACVSSVGAAAAIVSAIG
jgi:predicted  nucleic acid-binding Zn-ribbon protein